MFRIILEIVKKMKALFDRYHVADSLYLVLILIRSSFLISHHSNHQFLKTTSLNLWI